MEKINVIINGQEIEAAPGKTILEVVRENDLDDIPTLCHSNELEPYGSCFLCVVEVKGRGNLVPACATRIAPGMEVTTRNERIVASRKTALELLLSNHYADCVSPCMEGCPANVDAQGYIALSAMGLEKEAVDLIREANPLPAVCGRVCVRKCEVVCRREDVDRAVGINAIKRHVSDVPGVYDDDPEREPDTGKTVGIIGAGPAGLTAAWFLGRKGHRPVIYEAMPRSGGMLRYGIPSYRLPDDVIDNEVDYIRRAGAEIHYNTRVGEDVTIHELRGKHDALFVANGAWTGKPMRVEGEFETEGIVSGVDFLVEKADDPAPVEGTIVVVGGGNTAMDVARTAWRCGADKVIILYRRTKAEMPADAMEIEDAIDEGIEILELAAPIGIVAEQGRLKALRCRRMKLGEPDESGRRRPVPIEGSEFDQPCQLAVSAIGQNTVMDGIAGDGEGPELTKWKTFVVDTGTMETNVEGVFAGGDAADDGPTVVIDAIRDGQRAARAIHAYITGEELPAPHFVVRKEFWSKPGTAELGEVPESPRHEVSMIDVEERRGSFAEVATGFDWEDNAHETARCLSCGCVRYDDCALRLYAEEYGVDMEKYKGYVRKHKVDERHPYIVYDPNKCVLCSRCIRTCARVLPISALGLVNRGFRTEMRPALDDPLVETSCVSCGNCVDACPTGALTVKYPFAGRASLHTDDVSTHCAFCSLACPITVKRFGSGRYFIGPSGTPGDYLCRYGRFGHELFVKRSRIKAAEIRDRSGRRKAEICDAHREIVAGMRAAAGAHGADAVAVFVSPELTSEELSLAGRIAREALGTNNVASLSILETGNEAGALDASLGFTASTADRSCLAGADLIVCNNTAMESDHLVLAVDVIDAVRRGAKMIVANSTLDPADQLLSALALDPMRGRAAMLWSGVARALVDGGHLDRTAIEAVPGGAEFAKSLVDVDTAAARSGIDADRIREAADLVRGAERIVFVHSPDRLQDQAPGDMAALADLVILLRAAGAEVDLLLPRNIANSAALEVTGADPAFALGRRPSSADLAGARSHAELRRMLGEGSIRAALVIGEDPLAWERTGSWLANVEFLAAMDWTETETTSAANVVLPGSTYLETEGTRCNFEGRVFEYARAVEPPAGVSGREVLAGLAAEFGLDVPNDLSAAIRESVRAELNGFARFYWNEGEERTAPETVQLVAMTAEVEAPTMQPPVTHGENYKREIREVGTERYRVR